MDYDYMHDLHMTAKREQRRLANTKPLISKAAYNFNADGSAPCAYGNLSRAFEAYNEYRENCAY